ncbi:hypothetical protein ADK46_26380 [Streptomyces rimosus subsp. rimosus]|nr:hypothetical protein ADK46_26380 [Streptomyces rimosus subsp. rimosus]
MEIGLQSAPVRGEAGVAGAAVQQGPAQGPFQTLDVPAEGGLGDTETISGPGEVLLLGQDEETSQVMQTDFHGVQTSQLWLSSQLRVS